MTAGSDVIEKDSEDMVMLSRLLQRSLDVFYQSAVSQFGSLYTKHIKGCPATQLLD